MDKWVDYFLRFLFYIIGKFLVVLLVMGILVISFLAAKDFTNISVLISDGLGERAEVILKGEDPANLYRIFTEAYLDSDTQLDADTYDEYVVRSYIQDIDIKFKLIMPWQQQVVIKISETIDHIDGEIPEDRREEDMPESEIYPPDWSGGSYNMTMERFDTFWKITDINLVVPLVTQDQAKP